MRKEAGLLRTRAGDQTYMPSRREDTLQVLVRVGIGAPQPFLFSTYRDRPIVIGRSPDCDIVVCSDFVSAQHGFISRVEQDYVYTDNNSSNGTQLNGEYLYSPKGEACQSRKLQFGDVLRVEGPGIPSEQSVRIHFVTPQARTLQTYDLSCLQTCMIGRGADCQVVLNHVSVSRHHALITRRTDGYYLQDNRSTNGLSLNGKRLLHEQKLQDYDSIRIANAQLIYCQGRLEVLGSAGEGLGLKVENLSKKVGRGKNKKTILDNVSLACNPGELIAVVGGSGAGKSTLIDAISGFTPKTGGQVLADDVDLHENYDTMKSLLGYVPQKDIVYDNLRLRDMLDYAARMRMPADTTKQERALRVDKVLDIIRLKEHQDKLIRKLSGGQRKRASIAVELLADPQLFFLDEPMSGLDPGTEHSLMLSLRQLADSGKMIMLVTHSVLNLYLCDKVIVMGAGGKLCYCGHPSGMPRFFGVKRPEEVFEQLEGKATQWCSRFQTEQLIQAGFQPLREQDTQPRRDKKARLGFLQQYAIITQRYSKIMLNNRSQLLGILGQAFVFSLVVVLVSNKNVYSLYGATKTVNFVLACLGMWMGLFLAIREVTRERAILRREYMAGLRLSAYVCSKVTVLAAIALVQAFVLEVGYRLFAGWLDKGSPPVDGVLMPQSIESFITLFLVILSSVCLGLFLSAATKQPERITPYILMPQIVLAGVLFDLGENFRFVGWLVTTYWGNRAISASVGLNDLPAMITEAGPVMASDMLEIYNATGYNLLISWAALLVMGLVLLVGCGLVLRKLPLEDR
jgi:ABC-type multidrug transport system ATPase subunit